MLQEFLGSPLSTPAKLESDGQGWPNKLLSMDLHLTTLVYGSLGLYLRDD